jgi:hypothetical protein
MNAKGMHKMMQLISNFIQENDASLYTTIFSLSQFDEKINHMKISKS